MTDMTTYIDSNIEEIHFSVGFISSLICIVLGFMLLSLRRSAAAGRGPHLSHRRYIAARRALGMAYIIEGVFSLVLLHTHDVREQAQADFFPLGALVISVSQIMLFTAAALSLFNSRLVSSTMIAANTAPVALLLVMYAAFDGNGELQLYIRLVLFIFYLMQLVVYTVAFVIERRRYLAIIEDYFDIGRLYDRYSCGGISLFYFGAVGTGIWALASYFFTTLQQETLFTTSCTIYYVAAAAYYIRYHEKSSRIKDVTTPERWKETENFSRSEHDRETESLRET